MPLSADARNRLGIALADMNIGEEVADFLDLLDQGPAGVSVTVATQVGNVINMSVQLVDSKGVALATPAGLKLFLSDSALGVGLTAVPPDGGAVIGTEGTAIPASGVPTDALLIHGTMLKSGNSDQKFRTTTVLADLIGGVFHTKAATEDLVFTAAHVITASKFGAIRVQINAAGVISTKVVASPQAYALGDAGAAAIAHLPAPDAGCVSLGYILIENNAVDWTANGANGELDATSATAVTFVDETVAVVDQPKCWDVVANGAGVFDMDFTESGAGTWYPVFKLANGAVVVGPALTFV